MKTILKSKHITQGGRTRKHLFKNAVPTNFLKSFKHSMQCSSEKPEEEPSRKL